MGPSRLVLPLLLVIAPAAVAAEQAPAAVAAEQPEARPRRVLALYDYSKDTPSHVIWDRTLRETLEAAGPGRIEYQAEFLDAARFPGPAHDAVMHDYLGRKYAGAPVDVIVAMQMSTRFLLGPGKDLFPGVPIVHTVDVGSQPAAQNDDPRLVGIRGVFDARRTLELALGFHPGATEAVVVCGTACRDGFLEAEARRQLAGLEARIKLTYLTDLPLDETLARVRALPASAVVLFVLFYDPASARVRSSDEVAAEIARVARGPVYVLYSTYVEGGTVGGYVYSPEAGAETAARMALRILDGARPRDLGSVDAPIVPMFDWRALRRWGIDEARLPSGSVVRFRQPGAWETYRRSILAAAGLFLLALGLIAWLLVEGRARRRALSAVKQANADLQQRIAERESAEEELRRNHERLVLAQDAGAALRIADRRKDEFLALLAHELRNPLAPISMAVEIMRQLPLGDDRLTWARDIIARQVDQLARLVDDLRDVSRITLGKIEMRLEPLDLRVVASRALEASRPVLTDRSHRITLELPAEAIHVCGDAARLTQVISNLLNNAGKYTDMGGRVSLAVEVAGGDAVVRVSDNGIGIPAEMLERIFDMFTQVESAQQRSQGGLGLGLTLVKRIVDMHGGSVRAASEGEGRGSEIVVRLPLFAGAAQGAAPDAGPPAASPRTGRRISVIRGDASAAEVPRR
jgi:signal transduction histidine kinase